MTQPAFTVFVQLRDMNKGGIVNDERILRLDSQPGGQEEDGSDSRM